MTTTTSFLSCGSRPGSSPSTLAVCTRLIWFSSVIAVRTPSGTGLKLGWRAAATSLARSWPPSAASLRLASSVAQPLNCSRGSLSAGSSNCSPDHDVCTTCQGYPADGVVCTMIAPAAPWRAALSYLYVQRP